MKKRVEFIDLLRGWAVIVMIETHVVNATLAADLTGRDLFQFVKFLNGLVAPTFLFASGLAYAMTTRRKLNDYLSFGPPLSKQLGRLLFILFIGYMLHLPKFKLSQLLSQTTEEEWDKFFQADVLQCIAVSLLFMQGLLLVLKNERRLYITLSWCALAIVFLTPVMWNIDFWQILPKPIAGYLNGVRFQYYPGFPLFPWAAFLFAGASVGYLDILAKERGASADDVTVEAKFMKSLLWIAPMIIAGSFFIHPVAAVVYPQYNYWLHSPSFFFLRLGIVVLLCAGMFFYERWRGVSPNSVITLIGRQSLIVYATHLLLIYGNLGTFNFKDKVNRTFGYGEAAVATVVLLVVMVLLALGWEWVKRGSPRRKLLVQVTSLAVVIGVFLFGPGQ